MTLGAFVATSYTVHKDSLGFLISGTIGAIVNIILNFIMIPFWGATGAALATCISYIVVFVYRIWNTRKYLILNIFAKKHVVGYVLLLLAAMTVYVDHMGGQILLIIEFLISLFLFKDLIKAMFNLVCMRGRQK